MFLRIVIAGGTGQIGGIRARHFHAQRHEIGAVFLRTETELILKSRRVVPSRLVEAGFRIQFPAWATAAQDLVRRWRAS